MAAAKTYNKTWTNPHSRPDQATTRPRRGHMLHLPGTIRPLGLSAKLRPAPSAIPLSMVSARNDDHHQFFSVNDSTNINQKININQTYNPLQILDTLSKLFKIINTIIQDYQLRHNEYSV